MKNGLMVIIILLSMFILQACELDIGEITEIAESLGIENIEIDTDEGVEFECIPAGYIIIYNGEYFVWRMLEDKYVHPFLYGTKKEAIESANIYYDNKKEYLKIFPTSWIQVKTCTPFSLPSKIDY